MPIAAFFSLAQAKLRISHREQSIAQIIQLLSFSEMRKFVNYSDMNV